MDTKQRPCEGAASPQSDAEVAAYINASLCEGDGASIAQALGVVARARGMAQIAKDTGLSRAHLYTALSAEGNASFDTIFRVLRAVKLQLHVKDIE